MKKHVKKIVAVSLSCLMTLGLAACGNQNSSQGNLSAAEENDAKVIKVGFVYPKTGTYASFGEYTEEFTNYAVQQANNAGITVDGQKAIISLVTADSQSDPKGAKQAAEKLIEDKDIDIMITSKTADTTVPVSKVCEQKGIVCLSVDTPDEAWAVKTHRYSFHAGFNTEGELNSFKDVWDQTETNKRVGVLHPNDSEGSTMINSMPDFAAQNGYVAYDPGTYQPGQQDFTNVIRNLKTQKVEILAGVMSADEFSAFYQQLKEDGYLSQIKAITIAKTALFKSDIETVGVNGLCTEVWWTPDFPTVSSIDGKTSAELSAQFANLTGAKDVPATVGYDYANIEILYAVLNAAGSLDTDKLISAAENLDLDTVIGKINYNDQHYSVQPLASGQWVYDTVNMEWNQNIISATQIDGLETTGTFQALEP